MSPAPTLTPQLALDYLRELSADIRAGVVLDPERRPAGRPRGDWPSRRATCSTAAGDAQRAAGDDRRRRRLRRALGAATRIAVVCGRFALPSLIRYDLRVVLADLAPAEAA